MKSYDVTAIGELLIDFTENGTSGQGNPLFEANPGGAPCNVLAMLSRLGWKTAFIGKIGKDMFGEQLKAAVAEVGIDVSGLVEDAEVKTTLAFVHTLAGGDRDFSFYRRPGADMMLRKDELPLEMLEGCRIFYYGSLSMTDEPCRSAAKEAIARAKAAGAVMAFDPNLREPLWRNLEEAREQILYGLSQCDILKISDNEIQWLTGKEDFDEGIAALREQFDIPLILLSMGGEGSRAYHGAHRVQLPAFHLEETIETTGAGDTFYACILHYVLKQGWRKYTPEELEGMLRFANAAAALITTKKGALRVMPTEEEVLTLPDRV